MRGGTGYISSLEDLYTWFSKNPRVEWVLMQGFQDGVQQKGVIYRHLDAETDREDSWALLKQMIEINSVPGARFSVFAPNNEHGNGGYTVKVQLGEAPNPYQLAGLGSAPGYQSGFVSKSDLAAEIARERKVWELEQKIKDMETASLTGVGDVVKEKIMQTDFTPVVSGLMDMLNIFVKNATSKHAPLAVSVQGSPMDNPPKEGEQQTTGYEYDGERLVVFLDRIRPHFSDDEAFYTFMDKISAKFAENPALYKTMIG
ncbi:MAG: hypothetical protein HUU01_10340 [Saprospiraceae bacterium]|nr:hypothetical protein [Saprospiraceae bacterium]